METNPVSLPNVQFVFEYCVYNENSKDENHVQLFYAQFPYQMSSLCLSIVYNENSKDGNHVQLF